MAAEQRKLAHVSKRDGKTMKAISLIGTLFLPGAYLAVRICHSPNLHINSNLKLSQYSQQRFSTSKTHLISPPPYPQTSGCIGR